MPTLLIADDSMFQRFNLSKTARDAGFEVMEAANGRETLEMAAAHAPDVLLLDLNMPDMGGVEALEKLAASGKSPKVLVVTADIQETTRQRCLKLGVAGFLNKPVDEEALRRQLELLVS